MAITDAPKIITSRFEHADSHTLTRYATTGGYDGLRAALAKRPDEVVSEVKGASLLGRGGAGFPAGVKWGFCPPGVWPRYLVVNGDESEPGTYKDRLLMERDPHQLIEGILIACYAVGCSQAFLYVRGEMALAQERIAQALNDAYAAGYIGNNILGTDYSLDIVLHWGAGAYIVGEETALIESLEGNRGMPRLKPPFFPAAKGLYLQPTIVNNVETLANLPWIMRNGGAKFAELGAESSRGTRMFAVSGHVKNPGVFEVEFGVTTFRDLLYAPVYGGGIRGGNALKAFIPGGASAPWFYEEHLDLPLEAGAVGKAGSMLGSGAIVVMDETTDMVKAALRVVRFFARESCGKCSPCREGTSWLEKILQRILDGQGRPGDLDLLLDVCDNISPTINWPPKQTTICPLGPSAVSPIASAVMRFRDEFEAKLGGPAPITVKVMGGAYNSRPANETAEVAGVSDTAARTDLITITVDGKEVEAKPGELVIDACERAGTYIPRFCYHPRMEPVGMCRMCIVEVDMGRGPALQPSCMLTVAPDMKVDTKSDTTVKAQDGVLEFLLINHPLDCPVCDKGGECPLQDQTLAYGPGESRMVEEKRHFEKPIPISDLVNLDRERCILCDRCTRFAKDVAGDTLIHFQDRGNQTQVNTFPDHPFASYFSGNTVQICPVGALTATPYRFKARPWDLEQSESTCTTCSVGCRVVIDSSRNEVLRYQGVDIDPVNWGWLCDKGRFGFESVQQDDRLAEPLTRSSSSADLAPARWSDALDAAAAALRAGLDRSGPSGVAVIGGAQLSNESAYAWAKLAKGVIGTDHVDAQLGDGLAPEAVLGLPRATIDEVCAPGGTVVLLGPDLKEELGVLFLRLRHAVVNDGVKVVELSPVATTFSELASVSVRYRPGEAVHLLGALLDGGRAPDGVDAATVERAAALLADTDLKVVLGRASLAEAAEHTVDAAAYVFDARPSTTFLPVLRRANVNGALDMGLAPGILPGRTTLEDGREWFFTAWDSVPAERGLDTAGILAAAADGRIDTLVLLGADPLSDFPDHQLAVKGLAGARTVIALDRYLTESAAQADIVLPVAGFAEVAGTTTNIEGRISVLGQRVTPPGTARSDWMIASDLAQRLGGNLRLESLEEIWEEIEEMAPSHAGITLELLHSAAAADGVVAPLPAVVSTTEVGPDADVVDVAEAEPAEVEGDTDADGNPIEEPADEAADPKPAMLTFTASAGVPEAPPSDAYSLRLVTTRKMFDAGTTVQHSPSIAGIAPTSTVARIHPVDFERLGVSAGAVARATSAHGSITIAVVPDGAVLRGTIAVAFNVGGSAVGELIDATLPVTEIRLESA